MSLTIREVVSRLMESGMDMELQTNVDEIKFHPGNINVAELVVIMAHNVVGQDNIDDALSAIETAIIDLEIARRSLR